MKHIKSPALMFAVFILLISANFAFSQKMRAEDVLTKHLDSIGTQEKRGAVKSQIVVGEASVDFITQKLPLLVGRIVIASAGEKNFLGMNLNSVNYPREKFSYDGKDAKISFIKLGTRSVLGNFLASNQKLLTESLLGGTLNSSWALLNATNKKIKLSFDGTKKINGKEAYVLGYLTKGGDTDINLYFDKETFRHIRTEYKRTSSAGIGLRPEDSTRFSATRFKITEDFSDFKAENGLTLPHNYHILYSVGGGAGGTTEIEWTFNLTQFAFNQTFPASTFDADAN